MFRYLVSLAVTAAELNILLLV